MKFSVHKLWLVYSDWKWEKKILFSAAGLSLLPLVALSLWTQEPDVQDAHRRALDVDTYIPKGFVLVPIEVRNYEALDSVLGKFALVDLYQGGSSDSPRQHLVGRNVRLLRAPQNPSHFAVLVQESDVAGLIHAGAQFTVTVKRPGEAGTQFVKDSVKSSRKIVYEGGSP